MGNSHARSRDSDFDFVLMDREKNVQQADGSATFEGFLKRSTRHADDHRESVELTIVKTDEDGPPAKTKLNVEFPASGTSALEFGNMEYEIRMLMNGDRTTVIRGSVRPRG